MTKLGLNHRNQITTNHSLAGKIPKKEPKRKNTSVIHVFKAFILLGILGEGYMLYMQVEKSSSDYSLGTSSTTSDDGKNKEQEELIKLKAKVEYMEKTLEENEKKQQEISKPFPRPPQCTQDQLMKVRSQLPPEFCVHTQDQPYVQSCSFTQATKCPQATWLEEYNIELQKMNSTKNNPPSFLGISVGCNKGYDAINTLRMGTFDASINKSDWKKEMTKHGALDISVCDQDTASDMFEVLPPYDTESTPHPHGEMHCIEPMPQSFERLKQSTDALSYSKKGLVVTNAAVSKESGEMLFHTGGLKAGIENKGLDSCGRLNEEQREKYCTLVPVYSLYDYFKTHVKADKKDPINILSIDVEGFDGNVLLGATPEILKR
eukprot:15351686-Ditylum_brightwellii.AAC.1